MGITWRRRNKTLRFASASRITLLSAGSFLITTNENTLTPLLVVPIDVIQAFFVVLEQNPSKASIITWNNVIGSLIVQHRNDWLKNFGNRGNTSDDVLLFNDWRFLNGKRGLKHKRKTTVRELLEHNENADSLREISFHAVIIRKSQLRRLKCYVQTVLCEKYTRTRRLCKHAP